MTRPTSCAGERRAPPPATRHCCAPRVRQSPRWLSAPNRRSPARAWPPPRARGSAGAARPGACAGAGFAAQPAAGADGRQGTGLSGDDSNAPAAAVAWCGTLLRGPLAGRAARAAGRAAPRLGVGAACAPTSTVNPSCVAVGACCAFPPRDCASCLALRCPPLTRLLSCADRCARARVPVAGTGLWRCAPRRPSRRSRWCSRARWHRSGARATW